MISAQKFNRRGYGNRPFVNYVGIKPLPVEEVTEKKTPWYIRLINWFKNG